MKVSTQNTGDNFLRYMNRLLIICVFQDEQPDTIGDPSVSSTPRDADDAAVNTFLTEEGTLGTSHNVTFSALDHSQELFSQDESRCVVGRVTVHEFTLTCTCTLLSVIFSTGHRASSHKKSNDCRVHQTPTIWHSKQGTSGEREQE